MDIPKDLKYDLVYFLPHENEEGAEGIKFQFCELPPDELGTPIEQGIMGDKWHLIFFNEDDEGLPRLEDNFEAILVDPATYLQGLLGAGVYGCVIRKTDKSQKWVDDYLDRILKTVMIKKMQRYAESISEE